MDYNTENETNQAEAVDVSFLEASMETQGYNEDAVPGERPNPIPEGQYRFRFEFPKLKDGADESTRWSIKKTKKGDGFIGTSIKAQLLGVTSKSPITLEEFDSLRLAGRQFSCYLSSLVMFGRSSLTDFINCVSPEKFPKNASVKQAVEAVNDLMPTIPEGVATIKWSLFWRDASDEDKFKRLDEMGDAGKKLQKKFGRGASSFPKDEEGQPMTSFEVDLGDDEKVTLIALPQVDLFLPFTVEEV